MGVPLYIEIHGHISLNTKMEINLSLLWITIFMCFVTEWSYSSKLWTNSHIKLNLLYFHFWVNFIWKQKYGSLLKSPLFNVQLLYHHFCRQCHMGRGRGSSRSINVTGIWPSLPVLNKVPLHSLTKSQSWTLIDSVFFVEFNVSFAKQNNFYTVHTRPIVRKGLWMPVIASPRLQDVRKG